MNLFWILFGSGLLIFLSLAGLALIIAAIKHTEAGVLFDDNWMDEADPLIAGKKLAAQSKKK